MTVVTRFAPSPTGFLHIGGARTALFNWLLARHGGGQFRLRIEDTDRTRSTPEAVEAIFAGLRWLELDWDGDVVFQSANAARHRQLADDLLARGRAFRCYCTPEELAAMREAAKGEGGALRYDGRCRDRTDIPAGIDPVVRFRSPDGDDVVIDDHVQGEVRIPAAQLDDLVLLRSDGTPTYMLAVVADDHDMKVTHVVRGVDHLTNAARQLQLYEALGWTPPAFAHIPLIHGPDGAKLSKRHGAMAAAEYREMGFLPAAMRNYLARLGWSHGDDEIFSTEQAVEWFSLAAVGRSPARFDFEKLRSLNSTYIQRTGDDALYAAIAPGLGHMAGRPLTPEHRNRVTALLPELKKRAKDLRELVDAAHFLVADRPLELDQMASGILDADARELLARLKSRLGELEVWQGDTVEATVRSFADDEGLPLGMIAQPLRAALTGRAVSPGIFEVLQVLGAAEALGRLADAA
ncbi:MAG: glutamate--tRNA ligase [Proteobacteria bacterium]|nr:glutamate--tRNA ligase [Pseudomonadota bacterium]